MALAKNWDGGDGLTEDREKLLEVEAGEEVESERLRLKVIVRKVVGIEKYLRMAVAWFVRCMNSSGSRWR